MRPDFPIPRSTDDRAGKFHGKTLPLPAPKSAKAATGAVEFLIETYRNATDEIMLVPVAPLTNIAAALALYPKLVERVPEVVDHGRRARDRQRHALGGVQHLGRSGGGCVVLSAGFRKLTLVPLDATHRALVSRDDCAGSRARHAGRRRRPPI